VESSDKPKDIFAAHPALLVFFCTLIGAVSQVLIKWGAHGLTSISPVAMLASPPLFLGYALYGVNTILLVVALRNAELSLLYPIIALTYVWVAGLSVVIFHEPLNPFKVVGIAAIVAGVGVLGRGGRQ
jgi:multidrug transporter EmrE-like cation transporter